MIETTLICGLWILVYFLCVVCIQQFPIRHLVLCNLCSVWLWWSLKWLWQAVWWLCIFLWFFTFIPEMNFYFWYVAQIMTVPRCSVLELYDVYGIRVVEYDDRISFAFRYFVQGVFDERTKLVFHSTCLESCLCAIRDSSWLSGKRCLARTVVTTLWESCIQQYCMMASVVANKPHC